MSRWTRSPGWAEADPPGSLYLPRGQVDAAIGLGLDQSVAESLVIASGQGALELMARQRENPLAAIGGRPSLPDEAASPHCLNSYTTPCGSRLTPLWLVPVA